MQKNKCAYRQCDNSALDSDTGRHKRYCSDKCRQAAYRDRKGASPRRRKEKNIVYTSTLESLIIETWEVGDGQGAAALMELAHRICAPINLLYIESQVEKRQTKNHRNPENPEWVNVTF